MYRTAAALFLLPQQHLESSGRETLTFTVKTKCSETFCILFLPPDYDSPPPRPPKKRNKRKELHFVITFQVGKKRSSAWCRASSQQARKITSSFTREMTTAAGAWTSACAPHHPNFSPGFLPSSAALLSFTNPASRTPPPVLFLSPWRRTQFFTGQII